MRFARSLALSAFFALAWETRALAQAASAVPEPNDLLLFGLGVVGLIVGRQVARKKSDD